MRESIPSESELPPPVVTRRPRIWLVDDSPLQASIGKAALGAEYDVTLFQDGAVLLEAMTNAQPDLLVLDWHMPGLSGFDLCTFIRETRDAGELPILILTASSSPADLVEGLEGGANDFVCKPVAPAELQARVAALLRNRNLHAKLAETERRLRVEGEFREGFLGMLAHDLRQPLNTFILSSQTLGMSQTVDHKLIAMQRQAADRMTRMVRDLLDFARGRPQSGLPVDRQSMDLEGLASEMIAEVRAGHPGQAIELSVVGDCTGSWDRDRLSQLLGNLLGNAIHHGHANRPVDVHLWADEGKVALSVKNHGDPIPKESLETIFTPFRQGKRTRQKSGGVGLGLHIVWQIAQAHQGTVEVQSGEEQTVFSVHLPRNPSTT